MERTIVHLDLDSFFVSCERLREPKLVGRPVLIGADSDRGVVASCSYEARAFGVRSAMPMRTARQLCPDAIILRGDSGLYMRKSDEVTELIREQVPLFEKSSVDEFYVDLSGTEKFFGAWKLATELRQRITKATGLPNSFGLSINKTVSKVATNDAKPNNCRQVERGTEKPYLAPKPIEAIPGVGEKTAHLLRSMGVARVQTMQELPIELMQRLLGEHGPVLWRKANGIDDSPVVSWHERNGRRLAQGERDERRDVRGHQRQGDHATDAGGDGQVEYSGVHPPARRRDAGGEVLRQGQHDGRHGDERRRGHRAGAAAEDQAGQRQRPGECGRDRGVRHRADGR